jgi:hypothetical protein
MLDLDAIEAQPKRQPRGRGMRMSHTRTAPNADFIAHARTDVPALVAELRAARDSSASSFIKALADLATALAAYRAVVGEQE